MCEPMVTAARARVARASFVEGLTIGQLKIHADRGDVCILVLQAWTDRPEVSYAVDYEQGHFVVLTAVGRTRIYCMDPSLPRVRASLTQSPQIKGRRS